jgi:hypothetical protein
MTRHLAAACGAFALAGLSLTAQTSTPGAQAPDTAKPRSGDRATTMTGCLGVWTGSMGAIGSAPAIPGEAATPMQFVLTDASEGPATNTRPPAPGTPGLPEPPVATAAMAHRTVVVVAGDAGVDLKRHLDHKVEVTGVLTAPTEDETPAREASPGAAPTAPSPSLSVKTLKIVAPSCD